MSKDDIPEEAREAFSKMFDDPKVQNVFRQMVQDPDIGKYIEDEMIKDMRKQFNPNMMKHVTDLDKILVKYVTLDIIERETFMELINMIMRFIRLSSDRTLRGLIASAFDKESMKGMELTHDKRLNTIIIVLKVMHDLTSNEGKYKYKRTKEEKQIFDNNTQACINEVKSLLTNVRQAVIPDE